MAIGEKMNNNEFVAMIKDLRELREIRDAAKNLVKTRKAELLSDDELVVNTGLLEKVTADVEKLEFSLKASLVKNPEFVPPFKAAWLINSTSVKIDEAKALEWARVNMPVAIHEVLDIKMVEDWAKKNPEAADFAVITKGKKAEIATDLSKFGV